MTARNEYSTFKVYSCVPKFLWVAIFAMISYIPQVDIQCKRLLSVNAYLNLKLYHSMCLKDVHSYSFKKFKSSAYPEMPHKVLSK